MHDDCRGHDVLGTYSDWITSRHVTLSWTRLAGIVGKLYNLLQKISCRMAAGIFTYIRTSVSLRMCSASRIHHFLQDNLFLTPKYNQDKKRHQGLRCLIATSQLWRTTHPLQCEYLHPQIIIAVYAEASCTYSLCPCVARLKVLPLQALKTFDIPD